MSKSIYEKAIEIMNFNTAKRKVIHALQQAQKQEKLLEHYKKLSNLLEELKRDVKRFMELEGNYQKSSHEYHEMEYIKNKLMEIVGKERIEND